MADNKQTSKPSEEKPQTVPQLPVVEDDDEFEEFTAEEWKDEDTVEGAQGQKLSEHLWVDNWDDDSQEDDFSVALRGALTNSGTAMQTS